MPASLRIADLFALQITCLLWFETLDVVNAAVRPRAWSPHDVVAPPTERPSTEFRRWIRSILTTTQVTQNVILLALMYIYRLRKTAPAVRGRVGSEFRLMTVALMLGNKCMSGSQSSPVGLIIAYKAKADGMSRR